MSPDLAMGLVFAIIVCTIAAFVAERWKVETVGLATTVALIVLFSVHPVEGQTQQSAGDLLAGFASPALATVLALLLVGQGLFNTDALDVPTQLLAKIGGDGRSGILIMLATAGATSAFLNNTPVVVMFIPVIVALAARRNFAASDSLMPLSFVSILGGMTTLIGSSTNLLVAGVAEEKGHVIRFFDFTIPGLLLASVGSLYVLFIMPLLIRPRDGNGENANRRNGRQFIAQIELLDHHRLLGARAIAGFFPDLPDVTVRSILRDDDTLLPPFDDIVLAKGDIVVVAATRQALTTALARGAATFPIMRANQKTGERPTDELAMVEQDFRLAEAMLAPGSRFSGRTIENSRIRATFGTMVLGLQRRSRMPRQKMRDIRLEPGDTILLGGMAEDFARLRTSRDLLLIDRTESQVPLRSHARRSTLIFLLVIAAAISGIVPIVTAALAGALAMIATGCLTVTQAARAFDSKIYMTVGASLAAASAMEQTGGVHFLANGLVTLLADHPVSVLLSALFIVTALLTNMLSNNATAVLFAPVAIGVADSLGAPREAFIACIIFAANCSFASPIGYQTNLLVMGPGQYRFRDFLRAGIPLIVILWLVFTFTAPWYYGV